MILGILGLGFILRLISLNQSLWLDEGINVIAAQKFTFLGMITQYAIADFHPPGWFMILWLWGKLFGYSEIAVRLPSVIFGVATIYITYLIGKKLVSKNLGLLAALLIAINPLHIFYSQEARMYALATLAVVINFYLLVKLLKEEKINLFILVMSNLLIFSADYVAYLTFPAQFVFLLFFRGNKILVWLKGLFIALLIGIWWFPILLKQLSVGSVASANLPAWKFIVGGFDIKAVPLTLVKFIIGRISLADKLVYFSLLAPICSLFLFLILRGIRNIKGDSRNLLIIWIGIPIILATVVSFTVPIYSYFRLIFTLPAFIILIALGINFYQSKLRYVFLGVVLSVQVFATLVYLLNSSYQREDWRGAVGYLQTKAGSKVYFESSGTLPPFDYYAKHIEAKGALRDFPAKQETDLIDLEQDTKSVKDIFLIEYLVDISDPNRLVEKKLASLGYKQIEIKNFTGVGFIHHYAKE